VISRYLSPLRYPGGKARLAPYLANLICGQPVRPTVYAEPFAGGAGAALRLLADETVQAIWLNDLCPGIAAFWRSVFFDTEGMARQIEAARVDLDYWHEARAVFSAPQSHSDAELGFATFYLNRCNRSGILGARPIGGLNQDGRWKIDARFNRQALADRVRRLGQYRRRVQISQLDARDFLRQVEPFGNNVFLYVDPPYVSQGEGLYLDSLSYDDHKELADQLTESSMPWLLTYDVAARVTESLYCGLRTAQFNIAHTAQRQHVGRELAVFGPTLEVSGINIIAGANARWVTV
jgi:DNA adenine methylase